MNRDSQSAGVRLQIEGGAGPHEAAAVAAAVQLALAEDRARRGQPPKRPKVPVWVTVVRSSHPGRPVQN